MVRFIFFAWLLVAAASAAVRPHPLFSDHAVLQGGVPVPVWGTANPRAAIRVEFLDRHATAVADGEGHWKAELPPLEIGAAGELRITGDESFIAKDVLVGEVWLCSGQSNMGFSIKRSEKGAAEIAAATNPQIRMFRVERATSPTPLKEPKAQWVRCLPENVAGWTAVGYFFARDIQQATGRPVGLIQASWGGTDIEGWMSQEAIAASGAAAAVTERWRQIVERAGQKQGTGDGEETNGDGSDMRIGERQIRPDSPSHPGYLFNGMIHPVIPYALRGILWYQGENNIKRREEYRELFVHLIRDWRQRWGAPRLPFLFVQLPAFSAGRKPNGTGWADFRGVQASVLSEPETFMAVTLDLGTPDNLHPPRKREVGERLARLARRSVYGEALIAEGPRLRSAGQEGATFWVELSGGETPWELRPAEGAFEVAGADGRFFPAQARLEKARLFLQAPEVPAPTNARYAWHNNPPLALFDAQGLPAAPFSTGPVTPP